MSSRNIIIIVVVIVVLAVIGYSAGWFGGAEEPAPAEAPATTTN